MNSNSKPSHTFLFLTAVFFLFFFGFWSDANAAVFFSLPSNGTVTTGDTFFLEIRLDTEGEEVNAVEAIIEFPNEMFEVLDATNGGSFLTLWPRLPFFSNASGTVEFIGGTPNGFNGEDGLIGKILFKALKPQERVVISLQNGRALLNDGNATPARISLLESFFAIKGGPRIQIAGFSSLSHPDQLLWSKNNTFVLHWDAKEGIRYSYLLSRDAFATPDDIPDTPVRDIKYENLEDGIYYFHLREIARNHAEEDIAELRGRWGAMIDATPPEAFEVQLVDDAELGVGKFLSFSTRDLFSGLDRYEFCYGENVPGREGSVRSCRVAIPPLVLTSEDLKQEVLVVRAYDRAGNFADAALELPPRAGNIAKYIIIIIGGLLGIGILLRVIRMGRVRAFARTPFKGT